MLRKRAKQRAKYIAKLVAAGTNRSHVWKPSVFPEESSSSSGRRMQPFFFMGGAGVTLHGGVVRPRFAVRS